ncbi:uncharacterized protein EV154DRAFT_478767 [Mucor mucedo]|uniref:uncharacterized protein n=1 Tax=Mucor mucedo TaxID=29922 RepID=UPI00221F75F0|nr:uncharacterized protein EV154DRAFT_481716 [Mucor mucedo]XP_051460391.1 uncharacterized protein EV154DRAFT_478767 [Mucor mucedo]KAI7890902.1 hypothetical protein EV154DRAFT_481716 [Mucor mucedo]KAI7893975.1 hypothetical protein EV154DRAFT_478767 [Mucor mucedo]
MFAKIWSAFADGKEIYYKTPEHIKIYFNKRTEASVFNDSIALNQNICQSIRSVLGRPERMPESVAMLRQPRPVNHYGNLQVVVSGRLTNQLTHLLAVVDQDPSTASIDVAYA